MTTASKRYARTHFRPATDTKGARIAVRDERGRAGEFAWPSGLDPQDAHREAVAQILNVPIVTVKFVSENPRGYNWWVTNE